MNLNSLSGIIMILVVTAAFIYGLRYHKRSRWHRLLFIYVVISFFQVSAPAFLTKFSMSPPVQERWLNAINNLYTLAEFVIFYILFYWSFSQRNFRFILHTGVMVMAGIIVYQWYYTNNFYTDYYVIGFAQLVLLMIPCVLFLIEKFITIGYRFITEDPRFWPITGMLLVSSCMLPVFIGFWEDLHVLHNKQLIVTVNNFLYVIMFSSVIMALGCKPATSR